ncbi:MAG: SGNH/GDSL hydrolase family protein [Lachnospiraceae bacterium]|nr:SGNH/GDSL hydrolase family protein [Lachnospiraceae bacterium]
MKKLKTGTLMHIILLSAIVLLFAASFIKLYLWDKSSAEIPTDDFSAENFDTETEDFYVTVDPDRIENHTDDGITTIVMLGDSSLNDYTDESGVPALVREATEATIYNCSFANSTMSTQNTGFDGTYGNDAFSFYYLSMCIMNNIYQIQHTGLESATIKDETFSNKLDLLESIDFNTVDIIVVSYGAEDYLLSREVETLEIPTTYRSTIYTEALAQGIDWIRMAYPHIQFIVMSPTFCCYPEEDGTYSAGDTRKNDVDATLANYMIAAKNIAVQKNVTFLDNYWGIDIHAGNADAYLTESSTYPNADGRKMIADKLTTTITEKIYYEK